MPDPVATVARLLPWSKVEHGCQWPCYLLLQPTLAVLLAFVCCWNRYQGIRKHFGFFSVWSRWTDVRVHKCYFSCGGCYSHTVIDGESKLVCRPKRSCFGCAVKVSCFLPCYHSCFCQCLFCDFAPNLTVKRASWVGFLREGFITEDFTQKAWCERRVFGFPL